MPVAVIGDAGGIKLLQMRLDPFAPIASMPARIGKCPCAGDFAAVERWIGLYNAHAEQVARADANIGRSLIVGYGAGRDAREIPAVPARTKG